jgi:hypothetical protein
MSNIIIVFFSAPQVTKITDLTALQRQDLTPFRVFHDGFHIFGTSIAFI